jgi:hypothetical protein
MAERRITQIETEVEWSGGSGHATDQITQVELLTEWSLPWDSPLPAAHLVTQIEALVEYVLSGHAQDRMSQIQLLVEYARPWPSGRTQGPAAQAMG